MCPTIHLGDFAAKHPLLRDYLMRLQQIMQGKIANVIWALLVLTLPLVAAEGGEPISQMRS
jgi:hypothetical protein